jgi:integrase/recombinase XerD
MIHTQIKKAAVDSHATVNILRHSYATYFLEPEVDLSNIQEAVGHNSIKTTEIYTHVKDTNRY